MTDQVNPIQGDHDRVVMLTLNADGTPRQLNPEIIGNKETALAAAKEQFAQQAVSAKDVEMRGVASAESAPGPGEPDAAVAPLVEAHGAARDAAHAAAEAAVESLYGGRAGTDATGTANPALPPVGGEGEGAPS